jgi:hydrogenase nickel incorporation protein HypB
MCRTCGCSDEAQATLTDLQTGIKVPFQKDPGHHDRQHGHLHHQVHHEHPADGHSHSNDHDHVHAQTNDSTLTSAPQQAKIIRLEQDILAKNRLLAERNRGWLAGRDIVALNLMSSPGAGKTTLLERTIRDQANRLRISVIEGDQATTYDAERIRATGCKVIQLNTGTGCHLEADMTSRALQQLDPPLHSLIIIENVGNLVCPALFDLGERAKVVVMSVTEGADKPAKYPHAFRAADVMVLNKIDLLPYVDFDVDRCLEFARHVNPRLRVFQISATRGNGLESWYGWLHEQRSRAVTD